MIRNLLAKFYRRQAMIHGRFHKQYLKFCVPDGKEYAEYLRRHGDLQSIGIACTIHTNSYIADPALTRIGNNVFLTKCSLICHDGSIDMLNVCYDKQFDSVGPIDIKDNVFVGHGAIILPNVTIGPKAIVAAGAVVSSDVPENSIVGGVPAKVIGTVDALAEKLEAKLQTLPWASLIRARHGSFDPMIEPELERLRVEYFWNQAEPLTG